MICWVCLSKMKVDLPYNAFRCPLCSYYVTFESMFTTTWGVRVDLLKEFY